MIRGTDMEKDKNTNNYVFGLDIGTRSIVGVVGYLDNGRKASYNTFNARWTDS